MTHDVTVPDEEFWDARYAESDRIWSGRPNAALVREASDLAPGRALDLGCGEGADALWLAERGWEVTAVDISRVALDRAAGHAAATTVADRITWQHCDLGTAFPAGTFDLVTAQFLHSHSDMPREDILRKAHAAPSRPAGCCSSSAMRESPPGNPTPRCRFPLRTKSSRPSASRTDSGTCCAARNTRASGPATTESRTPAPTTP